MVATYAFAWMDGRDQPVRMVIIYVKPFEQNGFSHINQLDISISNFRVAK